MRYRVFVYLYAFLVCALAFPDDGRGAGERAARRWGPSEDLGLSEYAINLVGHAHIDLAYRWRWNETVHRIARDTFRGVLDLMNEEPGLTFAQSQMALYDAMKREYPDIYAEIKRRVAEGRWIPVGGTWAESDMILPAGESFIRQRLVGMQFAREEFGITDIDVLWVPDSFCGHASTLPNILHRCGIRYYVVGRGAPPATPIFWWQAPNGPRILAYSPAAPYDFRLGMLTSARLRGMEDWFNRASGVRGAMVLYGAGDHGGGPRAEDVARKQAIEQWPGAPRMVYDNPMAYFAREVKPHEDAFPVHQGTLEGVPNPSYLSQARNKQLNRECENLLMTAEKFATLASYYQRKPGYPRVDFLEAWKKVLFNQFHDILPGTSFARVYDDAEAELNWVLDEGRNLLADGLEYIATRIDTRGSDIPLVVFNPLSWARTDAVETTIDFLEPTEFFAMYDDQGREIAWQRLSSDETGRRWRVVFVAEETPSIGYRMFRVRPGATPSAMTTLTASLAAIENEFLRVTLSPTGAVAGIFDKQANREVLSGDGNAFALVEEAGLSSSWSAVLGRNQRGLEAIGNPELVEAGPVRAVVRRTFRSEDSLISVDTILYAGVPRVDFELRADWRDKDAILLAAFPTNVDDGAGCIEQPYGFAEVKPDGARHCAQQWVDLSNGDYGVSLLNNGRYEFYLDGQTLRMGVLRGGRDMDPRMDEGEHRFRYALYPHSGDWRDGDTVQQAGQLNHPLIALQESRHDGTLEVWAMRRSDFSLPHAHSFVSVSPKNLVVPVVKMPQEDWTATGYLVVRVFETTGRATRGELTLPFKVLSAVETDHLEETVLGTPAFEDRKVIVDFAPGELKTLKIRVAGTMPQSEGN
ncbi:MAG TPA: glycoside hydrolase family 38 C-terminal domain-containing protein [Candidatus Hydrogenedentes bacterium]|nr:glycoside hydrolase family 38 C-terminal domain-containing protein [Candidatus Hydrogenedentota bacterium]